MQKPEPVTFGTDFCLSLRVKIKVKNSNLLFGCVYRSPNSSPENNIKLNSLIQSAFNLNASMTVIVGDFNYKEIDWNSNQVDAGQITQPLPSMTLLITYF